MPSIAFYSLGCKVNQYEIVAMSELFSERGYDILSFDDICDVYVVNTCTVTNLGDKKSRQIIRRAKKQNPNAIVCAVGCYSQVAPDDVSNIEGVNLIVGSKNKSRLVNYVENYKPSHGTLRFIDEFSDDDTFEQLFVTDFIGRTRAFLKIQDGCSQYCSYCIVPYARGNICSRRLDDIYVEVNSLAQKGFKEIVLSGIHVASYGKDLGDINLLDVIKVVHNVDGIERIRLSSIDPLFVDDFFVSEISQLHKVCNHFHLSLQSGSDDILKSMNRHYTADRYAYAVKLLREAFANVALWTDVIVGFPGESDVFFEESYNFIKSLSLTKLHVFQYSPKKGTPAADFANQVDSVTKERRSKKMIELSNNLYSDFLKSNIGLVASVLFERSIGGNSGNNSYEGLTSNYIKVIADSEFNICSNLVNTLLKISKQNFIKGDIIFA